MTVLPITHSMTATAFTIEGYHTTRTLGVVRGVTVRMQGVTEIFCYGTAVVADRVQS